MAGPPNNEIQAILAVHIQEGGFAILWKVPNGLIVDIQDVLFTLTFWACKSAHDGEGQEHTQKTSFMAWCLDRWMKTARSRLHLQQVPAKIRQLVGDFHHDWTVQTSGWSVTAMPRLAVRER